MNLGTLESWGTSPSRPTNQAASTEVTSNLNEHDIVNVVDKGVRPSDGKHNQFIGIVNSDVALSIRDSTLTR